MEDYSPNPVKQTNKSSAKPEPERLTKVAKGKERKKGEMSKLAEIFIPGDVQNVKQYIIMDVIVPTVKRAIFDVISLFLYGEPSRDGRKTKGSSISYIDYASRSKGGRDEDYRSRSDSYRPKFSSDNIEFESRGDAEAVLDAMGDAIERYGDISVAGMYDIAGLVKPYTSEKYGWTSIRDARVRCTREGMYVIDMPRPRPL